MRSGRIDQDVVLATVLLNVLALSVPLGMMQIFNRVIPNSSSGTLLGIFMLLLVYVVLDTGLKLARMRLYLAGSLAAERETAERVFERLFHARQADLFRTDREALAERILNLRKIGQLKSHQTLASRIDLGFTGVFVFVIGLLSGVLAAVTIITIVAVSVWSLMMRASFESASSARDVNDTRRMSFLLELLRLSRQVKLLQIEQVLLRRYEMLQNSSSNANETLIRISASAATVSAIIGQVATGLVSVVGAYLVIHNRIGVADLAACILLTGRAVQPVIQALFAGMDRAVLHRAETELRSLEALEDEPARAAEERAVAASVVFEGVRVIDPWSGAVLLREFDMVFAPGSLTVLEGSAEAPVDRILRLVSGAAEPEAGQVRLHGVTEAADVRVIHLGPELDLFEGEFIENLTGFRGRSQEPPALDVARKLGIEQNIQMIPKGYGHVYAQPARGHGSPGFLRKLRLARTFGAKAGLLVLERPFLSLDPQTQEALASLIEEKRGETTIVLSDPPGHLALNPDVHITVRADLPPRIKKRAAPTRSAVREMSSVQ